MKYLIKGDLGDLGELSDLTPAVDAEGIDFDTNMFERETS